MKTLELKYRILGFNRVKKVNAPECWEELSPIQFAVCSRIYTDQIPEKRFVQEYFDLPGIVMRRLSSFQLFKLAQLTDFALKPEGSTNFFYLREIPRTGLLAPGDRLTGITLEHFAIFDTAFFDYIENSTGENLVRFIACLYLRSGEVISQIDFEKRLELVTSRAWICDYYSIFLNYIFVHRWLAKSFPFLFEEKEDSIVSDKTSKPVKPLRPQWNKIIDGFIGEDVINYDKYRQMPAIVALKTINKRIKDHRYGRK